MLWSLALLALFAYSWLPGTGNTTWLSNTLLSYDENYEFYIFPLFNTDEVLISSTLKRKCLTNDVGTITSPPYDKDLNLLFIDCDFSGSSITQIFKIQSHNNNDPNKYIVKLYNSNNPLNSESGQLLSTADINILKNKQYKIYFSNVSQSDRSLAFVINSNTFIIYLFQPNSINDNSYFVSSNYDDLSVTYCSYPLSYKSISSLEQPFFHKNRCIIDQEILLEINKLNNVVFKVKNMTSGADLTTSVVSGNINFSSASLYYSINPGSTSSFDKKLEFGVYSISLSVSDASKWEFRGHSFTVNSCDYTEVYIPIYEVPPPPPPPPPSGGGGGSSCVSSPECMAGTKGPIGCKGHQCFDICFDGCTCTPNPSAGISFCL